MPESGTLTLAVEHVELDAEARLSNPNARPGVYAVLAVADTGTGIPADVLDNIFDPFFTTKPLGQGSGLGLSTVQGIVAAHGGFVEVRTQPGGGSQFAISPRGDRRPARRHGRCQSRSAAWQRTAGPRGG